MSKAAVSAGIRGFSFMPENKMEMTSLQYVESEDLERTWKSSRRQRLKQQQQRIWEEFVKEQDVLNNVCQDDPYQFLEQLPESCLKELMEVELERMKKETLAELNTESSKPEGDGDISRALPRTDETVVVTFAEDVETKDDQYDNVFHIFDDEKDDDRDGERYEERSGAEDEALNESSSPCTVRERPPSPAPPDPASPRSPHSPRSDDSPRRTKSKSPENVTNMIETSIYCAKVRDLRPKICEEMLSIIESLESRDVRSIPAEALARVCRRAAEFGARFNRIYVYQLHRQLHDIKRHSGLSLPFARHTHYQSQMVRVVALHHSLLQALQVFHRSLEQTALAGEGAALLRSVAALVAAAAPAAQATPPPPRLKAAAGLYDDEMASICDKLDHVATEYAARMAAYISSTNTDSSRSTTKKMGAPSKKKKSSSNWSQSSSKKKTDADSRLSMYSLDTLRINLPSKSSSSRDNQTSGKSKGGGSGRARGDAQGAAGGVAGNKKSPRSRRPLMRAGGGAGAARARAARDADVRTMVEVIEPCTSAYISREASPRLSRRNSKTNTPQRSRNQTPRDKPTISPRPGPPGSPITPRKRSPNKPKASPRKRSPRPLPPLNAIQSVTESQAVEMPKIFAKEKSEGAIYFEARKTATPKPSPRQAEEGEVVEKTRNKPLKPDAARCEVTRIVRQLCGGDANGGRHERVSGAKNAQLHCVVGGSPRQPSTPQLLRILEETIQKKVPKSVLKSWTSAGAERWLLRLAGGERAAARAFAYRRAFVQHMLASAMYANCAVGKPWEIVARISEQLIDELLVQCAKEMELQDVVRELYKVETR